MLLVTTALEKTWGESEHIVFLGEWCKLYTRTHIWQARSHETLGYSWDDKALLESDSARLDEVYEKLLPELAESLNKLHGTSYTIKYWRILVGPWLGFFIQIAFQRWASIENATQGFPVSTAIVLTDSNFYLIPNDMLEFAGLFSGDEWNEYICGRILKFQGKVTCRFLSQSTCVGELASPVKKYSAVHKLKKLLLSTWNKCLLPFMSDKDMFFIATGLPKLKELVLKIRLGQVPQYSMSMDIPKMAVNVSLRDWRFEGGGGAPGFETFLRQIIPSQIPKVYVEGYGQINALIMALDWPKSPTLIFSAVGQVYDDLVKVYIANKVDKGSKLVIGQHGGGPFHAINFQTDHELDICDMYLAPGTGNTWHPKVRCVGQLFARHWTSDKSGGGLLMGLGTPRYSFSITSTTQSDDFNQYLAYQSRFISALPWEMRKSFMVRLAPTDNGWGNFERWKDAFPEIRINNGVGDIHALFAKAKIIVCTYAGTTYNQTLAANAPTVIFWNRKYEKLHKSAEDSLCDLRNAGIFHDTPESAAAHVSRIWSDIDSWWLSAEVQVARRHYCQKYAYLPSNSLELLKTALEEVSR